ncbi:hypothetical protein [Massilia sp. DD77]|uniref:hypothetical protein n=1 Tax=Massilia sp. DD77 TaxID=3109349 RepID=UPI002FFF4A3E
MNYGFAGSVCFAVVIAIAMIVYPGIVSQNIPCSPLLLLGIVFVSNLAPMIVRVNASDKSDGLFSPIFFKRLVVSLIFSGLLIAVHKVASSLT